MLQMKHTWRTKLTSGVAILLNASLLCLMAPCLRAAAIEARVSVTKPDHIRVRFDGPFSPGRPGSYHVIYHYFDGNSVKTRRIPVQRASAPDARTLLLELKHPVPVTGLLDVEHQGKRVAVVNQAGLVAKWKVETERHWLGRDFWGNRLQDWRLRGGRLECLAAGPNRELRTVHVLTREVLPAEGNIAISVRTGVLEKNAGPGFSGFLIGAGGGRLDYRAAAMIHDSSGKGGGLLAAFGMDGSLSFRDNNDEVGRHVYPDIPARRVVGAPHTRSLWEQVQLDLEVVPTDAGRYELRLSAWNYATRKFLGASVLSDRPASDVLGSIALVSSPMDSRRGPRFWFTDLRMGGSKLAVRSKHGFGPVAAALYTLNRRTLKMNAQFLPIGRTDPSTAVLEYRPSTGGSWSRTESPILSPGYTALFRVKGWDGSHDWDYRIRYDGRVVYNGRIRKDPVDKNEIVVAAFTGQMVIGRPADNSWGSKGYALPRGRWTPANVWFPHQQAITAVRQQRPDILFFTGDQIYESGNPTAREDDGRFPELDYLYRWYYWCWSLGQLARDTPAVCQTDDHDVYQGNIWGWDGRRNVTGDNTDGGYMYDPGWINMVQRTQTAQLPDPYDATPIKQGITVFYTSFNYGGISFAVLEDRKFKSPPPKHHAPSPEAEPKLLGERQLRFLKHWANNWKGAKMKVAVSQTVLASVQTGLKGRLIRDFDSDGWPVAGRDRAIDILRRGHAFTIAGDTHLSFIVQHGIERYRDGIYQFCVPALANKFRRWFEPAVPGRDRKPGSPTYTGDFEDAFGNKITVYAVANPKVTPEQVRSAHTGASFYQVVGRKVNSDGYGIIRLNKRQQTIRMESWPWNVSPDKAGAAPYKGWPVTITLAECDGRKPVAYLPDLEIHGLEDPVVQVTDQKTGEIIYTTRAKQGFYRPGVFRDGVYQLQVGEPGLTSMKTFKNLRPAAEPGKRKFKIEF